MPPGSFKLADLIFHRGYLKLVDFTPHLVPPARGIPYFIMFVRQTHDVDVL